MGYAGEGGPGRMEGRHAVFDAVRRAALDVYGDRLVSLAVYGSYARGTQRPDSDLDLLVVVRDLPRHRPARWEEWDGVERLLAERLRGRAPVHLSPLLKSPEAIVAGTPLLLDLTEDAVLLFDRDGFLAGRLEVLRRRLRQLGARRIRLDGDRWVWDLKPDYRPGEVFEW